MLCILIIVFANEIFWLLPEKYIVIPGIFRIGDAALILIFGIIAISILYQPDRAMFKSKFTLPVMSSIILIFISSYVAYVYYNQPLIYGIRALRWYLYYFFFFALIALIDTPQKLNRFLTYLNILSVILIILVLIQYTFPQLTIFHYEKLWKIRGGRYRFLNPGLHIVVFCYFILLANVITVPIKNNIKKIGLLALFLLQIILSQVRAVIIGILAVSPMMFLFLKRFSKLAIVLGLIIYSLCTLSLPYFIGITKSTYKDNFLAKLLISAYTDIINVSGTVEVRYNLGKELINLALKHPITGSGVISPASDVFKKMKYSKFLLTTDLGYILFFSRHGLIGLCWLLWLSFIFFFQSYKVYQELKIEKYKILLVGVIAHFVYVLITFVTLPHFTFKRRIILIALNLALVEIIPRLEKIEISKPKWQV